MILSTSYLPPIEYFAIIAQNQSVQIEKWEHYVKQSYRNRAIILSANGPLDLILPVEKPQGSKTLIKDVKIAYHDRWNAEHWNAIISAYNSSPFFEYYRDDLEKFFNQEYSFLLDYNTEMLHCILKLLHITYDISYTNEFTTPNNACDDWRYTISPKVQSNSIFQAYTQVFENKFAFVQNLCILDLLCNMGPDSKEYLQSVIIPSRRIIS